MDLISMVGSSLRLCVPGGLLVCTCLYGDGFLAQLPPRQRLERAVVDSATHGSVGVLSWILVRQAVLSWSTILEAVLCGILASIIDVDHFLAARSLKLENALQLPSRPPLHSTTLILILCFLVWAVVRVLDPYGRTSFSILPWLCVVAWITHQTRDAHRRGFWFPPFGSTPPLSRLTYLLVILATVLVVSWIVNKKVVYMVHPERGQIPLGANEHDVFNV